MGTLGGATAGGFRRPAIVGCGLIGGSIALALRDRCPGVALTTLDRGDDLSGLAGADLIVLAAPIGENIRLLPALRRLVSPDAIITDTGSTKGAVTAAASGVRFVGGHPVAGAAVSGRAAARADLFAGRPWILTPAPSTAPDDVDRVRGFAEGLGASVQCLDADEHDRLFALISHLPQLAISALMHVAGTGAGREGLALAGSGLRDTTRLASSPPGIWRDVLLTNQGHIGTALDAFIAVLSRLRNDPDGTELTAVLESAAAWKRQM